VWALKSGAKSKLLIFLLIKSGQDVCFNKKSERDEFFVVINKKIKSLLLA